MKKQIGAALVVFATAGIGWAGASMAQLTTATAATIVRAHADDDDPVTGDWEGTLSNDQMPEDVDVTISLALDDDGTSVTGGFTVQEDTADLTGDWDVDASTITGTISDPDSGQELDVELTIDGDDMTGTITVEAGDVKLVIDVTATRSGE